MRYIHIYLLFLLYLQNLSKFLKVFYVENVSSRDIEYIYLQVLWLSYSIKEITFKITIMIIIKIIKEVQNIKTINTFFPFFKIDNLNKYLYYQE